MDLIEQDKPKEGSQSRSRMANLSKLLLDNLESM